MAQAPKTGVLNRLRRDNRGNVMMLTAAAVIPLLGMVGAAFDVSRIYLIKTRLQHACDASVLAYRRSMNGANWGPANKAFADTYFKANFTPGRYGSNSANMTYTPDSQNVIHGDATVIVPMSVMKVFSMRQVALEATCNAQLQLPNTDVMFVLDTTGSMTDTNPGDSANKITGLRNAVMSFYNTLEGAKIPGTQVRYGFVPYSNTVNVGLLLKREWMANSASYQSRELASQTNTPNNSTTTYNAGTWTPGPTLSTYAGDPENCAPPANNYTITNSYNDAWVPDATSLPRSRKNYRTVNGATYSSTANSNGTCTITKSTYNNLAQTKTETYTASSGTTWTQTNTWKYHQISYDVSAFKGNLSSGLMQGGSIYPPIGKPTNPADGPVATSGNQTQITWNASSACIEERKTRRPDDTSTPAAGEPYDENVDLKPTTDPDTQWKPYLPGVVYARNVSSGYTGLDASGWAWSYADSLSTTDFVRLASYPYDRAACPSPARKLMSKEQGLTQSVLQTYVNSLVSRGDTYHDIGFLWGLRLASAQGLFDTENVSAPNGFDISRNIIFMTDGDTESHIQDYDAYGLSALDRRRTGNPAGHLPTDSEQNQIVQDRLSHYCDVAKAKGMTVWVIAFGTSLTSLLSSCASTGKAYQANDSAALNAAFADIASKIAQLRLTQ